MKAFLFSLAALCIVASVVMYVVGSDSTHLSELKDFWYVPLPLALVALLGALRKK